MTLCGLFSGKGPTTKVAAAIRDTSKKIENKFCETETLHIYLQPIGCTETNSQL
jgi:hypothetical protein